jgi:hypothetical protein
MVKNGWNVKRVNDGLVMALGITRIPRRPEGMKRDRERERESRVYSFSQK